jgi:predicted O-methyltransferase YrrM
MSEYRALRASRRSANLTPPAAFDCVGCSRRVIDDDAWEKVVTRGKRRPALVGVWAVLTHPEKPHTDWSINQMLAIELTAYLDRVRPRRILEAGSGYSTAILAAYAAQSGTEVVTLEHDRTYYRKTMRGLHQLGLDRHVDLRLAPLRPHWFEDRGPYQWYDSPLEGDFDFVFIDGPPKVLGRRAAFFALQRHLRPGWEVWIDDGSRQHEHHSVKVWEEEFSGAFLKSRRRDIGGKGVFVLRDTNGVHDHAGNGTTSRRLGIGILGSGDRSWWDRIERDLGAQLLTSSHVVVVDRDEPGRPLPRTAARFVDELLPANGRLPRQRLKMFGSLVRQPGIRHVLYLDDRWSQSTLDAGWLTRALQILEDQPDVEQVSLRHLVDVGVAGNAGQQPFTASFTGEPSLLRADRLGVALQSEWARRRPRASPSRPGAELEPAALWTVQLSPGVFRRNDRAGAQTETAFDADGDRLLSAGGILARAARAITAWAGQRRAEREPSST